MDKPFKVLGIQQIAIGGVSKERLKALWVDMFGLRVTGTYQSERENVDEDICTLGAGEVGLASASATVDPGTKAYTIELELMGSRPSTVSA